MDRTLRHIGSHALRRFTSRALSRTPPPSSALERASTLFVSTASAPCLYRRQEFTSFTRCSSSASSVMDDSSPAYTIPADSSAWLQSLGLDLPDHTPSASPFTLALGELETLTESLLSTVRVLQIPVLDSAAAHLLSLKGKRVRPTIVILMAQAAAVGVVSGAPVVVPSLLPSQRRLAEITELIHAASLLHDDVIDGAATRRGAPSANATFGNQLAVLAGDFLLARASVALARLRDCDVVELLSTVIEHLVRGEVIQMRHGAHGYTAPGQTPGRFDYDSPSTPFETYMAKTFFKTASLLANSARAVCMLGMCSEEVCDAAFRYGEHLGLAFQLVDDVLDMTACEADLGKPVCDDMRQGHATAPVLFALQASESEELRQIVARKFSRPGDVDTAMRYVRETKGVERTRRLAEHHAEQAVRAIVGAMQPSEYRAALVNLAHATLTRKR